MLLLSACAPSVEVPGDPDGLDSVEEIGGVEETVDIYELPADMPTVEVIITAEAMARLDADPYLAEDETGTFVDGTGRSYEVDLNYRGAYALKSVMAYYDLRNWKVKFGQDDDYLSRREWNFNYEPHFRQKLAYDLFRFAGVEVPSAQHVVLLLNGSYQGMYLQYEDPDSKGWLDDSFGDDGGDLYKAATDLPGVPQCFADLTVLGSEDADYDCHYQKKTNHKDAPGDFGVLRSFIDGLAQSDPAWFEESFEVQSFLAYLVVSNFIANWDSYPQRPKNYWLYEGPRRVVFIPWDLDGTFNPNVDATFNQMGTTASVFFELFGDDYDPPHESEGNERPLVHRLLADPDVEAAYLAKYREVVEVLANPDYLQPRLEALTEIVDPHISETDRARLGPSNDSLLYFVQQRHGVVSAELDSLQ